MDSPDPILDLDPDDPTYTREVRRHRAREHLSVITPDRFRCDVPLPPDVEGWLRSPAGRGLYLCGPIGVGKTHTAWTVIRAHVESHGGVVVHWRTTGLLDELRPGAHDWRSVVRRCQSADLLLLDDLGAERPSDWTCERLYEVLDDRYRWERPTVFTSNLPPMRLAEHIGERAASRIAGMSLWVAMTGEDRRRSPGAGHVAPV